MAKTPLFPHTDHINRSKPYIISGIGIAKVFSNKIERESTMIDQIGANSEQMALASQGTHKSKPVPESPLKAENEFKFFGKDGFTFFDFLDVINPLQHIPVVSTLYRSLTGDEIDPASHGVAGRGRAPSEPYGQGGVPRAVPGPAPHRAIPYHDA